MIKCLNIDTVHWKKNSHRKLGEFRKPSFINKHWINAYCVKLIGITGGSPSILEIVFFFPSGKINNTVSKMYNVKWSY